MANIARFNTHFVICVAKDKTFSGEFAATLLFRDTWSQHTHCLRKRKTCGHHWIGDDLEKSDCRMQYPTNICRNVKKQHSLAAALQSNISGS